MCGAGNSVAAVNTPRDTSCQKSRHLKLEATLPLPDTGSNGGKSRRLWKEHAANTSRCAGSIARGHHQNRCRGAGEKKMKRALTSWVNDNFFSFALMQALMLSRYCMLKSFKPVLTVQLGRLETPICPSASGAKCYAPCRND